MVSHKIKLTFAKRGDMRFISHLDLMRLFARASRRAGLPLEMTRGFSPHPKISIQPALRLGAESGSLEAVIGVSGVIAGEELTEKLQKELPEEIEIIKAAEAE